MTMTVVGTADLGASHLPYGLVIASDDAHVYAAVAGTSHTVEKIQTSDMTVVGTCALGASHDPFGACITSDDAYVYVANYTANTVEKIQTSDMTVVGTCSLGASHNPRGICITSDNSTVYVACSGGQTVEKIRTSDMAVIGTYALGAGCTPTAVGLDSTGSYVYATTYFSDGDYWGVVEKIRTSDMTYFAECAFSTMNEVPDCGVASIVFSPDGDYVYVPATDTSGTGYVEKIQTSDMTVVGTCSLGAMHHTYGLAITPDGFYLYSGVNLANTVEKIQTSDMTVVDTGALGASHGPYGVVLSHGETYVYVGCNSAYTVEQIRISSAPIWVSPADAASASAGDALVWTSLVATKRAHFRLQVADDVGFASGLSTYYSYANSGFEYWDGAAWQTLGAAGMPAAKTGNDVRYAATSGLTGTKYRRVGQTS
jgi:DNA-binding beta-propeller fold protein YncE